MILNLNYFTLFASLWNQSSNVAEIAAISIYYLIVL